MVQTVHRGAYQYRGVEGDLDRKAWTDTGLPWVSKRGAGRTGMDAPVGTLFFEPGDHAHRSCLCKVLSCTACCLRILCCVPACVISAAEEDVFLWERARNGGPAAHRVPECVGPQKKIFVLGGSGPALAGQQLTAYLSALGQVYRHR